MTCLFFMSSCSQDNRLIDDARIVGIQINPKKQNVQFHLYDSLGHNYSSLGALKEALELRGDRLFLAMNGGMYTKDQMPQGLYIEDGQLLTTIDTIQKGYGNFYLQPNGIFYLTEEQEASIITTQEFKNSENINYATQSGPMLVINDTIHPKLRKGSSNLNIRNGVGILENGNILFAISTQKINFYDFAEYFSKNGCKNALYLDGFVSRAYIPSENQNDLGGNFGVMISVTESNKN